MPNSAPQRPVGRNGSRLLHYGYAILFLGLLTDIAVHAFSRQAYGLILPAMRQDLGLSYSEAGLAVTGNFVGYTTAAVVAGMLATRYGPRVVVLVSTVALGLAMASTALAHGLPVLFATRTLAGLAGAGAFIPLTGLTSAWFPANRRGLANGVIVTGSGVGSLIMGPTLPVILSTYGSAGWRYTWVILGIIVIIIGIAGGAVFRNAPRVGSFRTARPVGKSSPGWAAVCRTSALWKLTIAYAAFGFTINIYATFFISFLMQERGFSAEQSGRLWAIFGAVSILSGFSWGRISDTIGRGRALGISCVVQIVVFSMLGGLAGGVPVYAATMLYASVYLSIPAIMTAASADYAGTRLAPTALGFMTIFYGIGAAVGPWLGGQVAEATGTFTTTFFMCSAVAAVGAASTLLLPGPARAQISPTANATDPVSPDLGSMG